MAERLVILLPNTIILSQIDSACFTVLATLERNIKIKAKESFLISHTKVRFNAVGPLFVLLAF